MHDLQAPRVVTLRQVWNDYQSIRQLKPRTVAVYRKALNCCVNDWLDRDVFSITKNDIEERYISIKGKAVANLVMRVLRALISFASYKYERPAINPVKRLSELKAWHRIPRRKRFVQSDKMPAWFRAVMECEDSTNRDLHLLLMFTGLRKTEARTLQWQDIDFTSSTLTIRDTKNGDSHTLPMSTYVRDILSRRINRRKADPTYVFGGRYPNTPIHDTYRGYKQIAEAACVPFHYHDLRRSFASVADDIGFPIDLIKRLLNHRSNDVTLGYLCNSVERLRAPLQAINDEMIKRGDIQWR